MSERFTLEAPPVAPVVASDIPTPAYGHLERVGLRKLGNPAGFHWFAWECIDDTDAIKLTGCVVTRLCTKGARKGRPSYDKPHRVAVVTEAEIAEERTRYIAETGNCGECSGTGRVFHSWDYRTGNEYRLCRVCSGTGRHPVTQG